MCAAGGGRGHRGNDTVNRTHTHTHTHVIKLEDGSELISVLRSWTQAAPCMGKDELGSPFLAVCVCVCVSTLQDL